MPPYQPLVSLLVSPWVRVFVCHVDLRHERLGQRNNHVILSPGLLIRQWRAWYIHCLQLAYNMTTTTIEEEKFDAWLWWSSGLSDGTGLVLIHKQKKICANFINFFVYLFCCTPSRKEGNCVFLQKFSITSWAGNTLYQVLPTEF